MYRARVDFRDLEDNHLYKVGDEFPFDGRDIPSERITALASKGNKANKPVIEAVGAENGKSNINTKEVKKAVKSRKKA